METDKEIVIKNFQDRIVLLQEMRDNSDEENPPDVKAIDAEISHLHRAIEVMSGKKVR